MEAIKQRAEAILREFKGAAYAFGSGVLDEAAGKFAGQMGKKAMVVGPIQFEWYQPIRDRILKSLDKAGVKVVDVVRSAAPNAPFVDVYRIHSHIMHKGPEVLVVSDGGSGIDAGKAPAHDFDGVAVRNSHHLARKRNSLGIGSLDKKGDGKE